MNSTHLGSVYTVAFHSPSSSRKPALMRGRAYWRTAARTDSSSAMARTR